MNQRKFFGTDGIRGEANSAPMDAATMLQVAMAAASLFRRGEHRHRVVIGKDTRLSGYLLEPALTAGFISMGMDVILLGPLPTPAVAMLTTSLRADLGVMISASHNPYEDNGIKLFGPDGYKLSDELEAQIEALLTDPTALKPAAPAALGRASRLNDALGRYVEWVKGTFPRGMRLDGLKIVIDCAHGAAYRTAPAVLWELGAQVIPLAIAPDGMNINAACGATAPQLMQNKVLEHGAHIGLALDGDADRLIVADETGHRIDGDQLMAVIAADWQDSGRLKGQAIVATVMSNLGLERFLAARNIDLHRTPVGDRYVLETMRRTGCNIGGEQSGHILLNDHATSGDGLIAALQILAVLQKTGKPASQALRQFAPMPQILQNVRLPSQILEMPQVTTAITTAEARLNGHGRLLIRPSGTEPVIRVMAEGEDEALLRSVIDELCTSIIKAA
jgi:phosphoglucosamine mutase